MHDFPIYITVNDETELGVVLAALVSVKASILELNRTIPAQDNIPKCSMAVIRMEIDTSLIPAVNPAGWLVTETLAWREALEQMINRTMKG